MALIKEYLELTKKYSNEYGERTIILMQNVAFRPPAPHPLPRGETHNKTN